MNKVYSFKDHRVVASYKPLGRYLLSNGGLGRVTVSYASDIATITAALDGTAIINRKHRRDGAILLEVPQVGEANDYLEKWANYCRSASGDEFATGVITIVDAGRNTTVTCTGVVPQKNADVVYDDESSNRVWTLIAADITMG